MSEALREEWRDLGFFYDRDDMAKEWRVVGSRSGVLRLRDLLLSYVSNPRNEPESEHDHFGPYAYFEIMTWREAGFDEHSIHGSLEDLARLASLIEMKLREARAGSRIKIQGEFAPTSPYALVLDVR